jgi:predicted phage terminase large subunit-like protein
MVVQVWQTDGRDHYLLDVFAAICDYERLWGELARLVRRFPPSMILIEESSTGSALISQAKARLSYEVRAIVPRGSKSARFRPHFTTIKNGRVHVPTDADWVADWVEEIRAFPEGRYDDHVDALSMFLDFMATRPPLVLPKEHGGGRCVRAHDRGVFSCVSAGGSRYFRPGTRPRQPLASPAANGRASLETSTPRLVETRFGPVIIKPR